MAAKAAKKRKRAFASIAAAEKAYNALHAEYMKAMELAARLDMAWRDELNRDDPDVLVWGREFIIEAYRLEHPTGGYVVVRERGERARNAVCHNTEEWVYRIKQAVSKPPDDMRTAAVKIRGYWERLKNETGS